MRRTFLFLILAVVVAGSGCTRTNRLATAPSPTSPPEDMGTLQNGENKVRFAFWQDERQLVPDPQGVVHLKPQPFEIQFTGSVGKVLLLALSTSNTADAMDNAQDSVITLTAMSAAYSEGTLLIEDEAKVQPWKQFVEVFGKEEAAQYTQLLRDKLVLLPTVLECAWQPLYVTKEATAHTLKVTELFKADLKTTKELTLVVMLQQPVDGQLFMLLKWRRFRLSFDQS